MERRGIDAWSHYLPVSQITETDWVELNCGNFNTETQACSGRNYE